MSRALVRQGIANPWTTKIIRAWQSSIEGLFETGRLLLRAKADLEHGEFLSMVERDLPFGPRFRQMLMKVAADPRLADAKLDALLPPSVTTFYQLSRLDDVSFQRALTKGAIRREMTRTQAGGLVVRAQRVERARRAAEQGLKGGTSLWLVDPPWPMRSVPYRTMTLPRIRDLRMRHDWKIPERGRGIGALLRHRLVDRR